MQNYAQTALNKMERQKSFYDVVKDKIVPKIDYQAIIDSGLAFNDEDFPPNVASLVSLAKSMHKPDKAFFLSEIVWAKANQMFGPYYELFGEISPSRIVQGRLGDCYFLSAVSALAEFPDRVKSIFVTREVNPSGCYALQVYISGYLRTMVVDDYIPCYPGTWKPAFTKSIGNELWVLLLEKAWAKVNDNYENIEEGDPEEALTFLTGAPSITLYSQDDDDGTDAIWQKILQADKNNYIICACAGEVPGTDPTDYEKVGIQSNHAYSLLAAKELQHHGKALRLLQLRNPWGAQDWVGDWSEVSPLWTEDLKRKVHYANKDRGAFFISFDDYVRYFSATVICKYHEDYCSQSFEVTQKAGQYLCFVFQIDTITLGYILVHQLEKRFMREKYKDYDYSPVSVLLAKVEADGSVKCIGEGAKKYRAKSMDAIGLELVYPTKASPVTLFIPSGSDAIIIYRVLDMNTRIQTRYSMKVSGGHYGYVPTFAHTEEFQGLLLSGIEFALSQPSIIAATKGPSQFQRLGSSVALIPSKEEAKVPLKRESEPAKVSACPKGHKLSLRINSPINNTFKCSNCSQPNYESIGVWTCDTCKYHICPMCYAETSAPKKYTCSKQHPLEFTNSDVSYRNGIYYCDLCSKVNKCQEGRLNCATCKFDICPICKQSMDCKVKDKNVSRKSLPYFPQILEILLSGYVKLLTIEDLLVMLCLNKTLNQTILFPRLKHNLNDLLSIVLKNGQNQFRKWLKHKFLAKLQDIPEATLTEYLVRYTTTTNQIKNSSGQEGFDNWTMEYKDNSWTIEDEWVHLPNYRKSQLCFCGSSTVNKMRQTVPLDRIKSILERYGYNCVISTGAYVARRHDTPCEFGFCLSLLDANGKTIDYRQIVVGQKLPERGLKGEKYAYKFIEMHINDADAFRRTETFSVQFWTKALKSGTGWRGARVTDVFFRVIPRSYLQQYQYIHVRRNSQQSCAIVINKGKYTKARLMCFPSPLRMNISLVLLHPPGTAQVIESYATLKRRNHR
eukprot:TRINITY_DN161_c0_g2_i13.p1 TRINITY_DN161_c0_g2~~TRINITY_DN161_c0_g2_i13.p1  ORF type:complete len:1013 (-),score=54.22 TRINITY_DN161_c0_g2_i13:7418-10456(-)